MAPVGSVGRDDEDAAVAVSNAAAVAPPSVPPLPAISSSKPDSTSTAASPASHPHEQKEQQQQQQQPRQEEHPPLPPQPLQQNGDSQVPESKPVSEAESNMANYRPQVPALHSLPTSYPANSPSISSPAYPLPTTNLPTTQYASYPAVTSASHPADGYRVSPVGTTSMSLPSMRTIDPMSQQVGAQTMPHHSMSMPMNGQLATATSAAAPPYYANHSMSLPSNYGIPQDTLARYPLPHDPRLVGHRGPKKEIKRRTKTGCLTCRKRRIKCDETHPTCNNCKKSKRDCLGYDPIFRQQVGNQPGNNIQPAPSNLPPSTPTSTISSASPTAVSQSPAPRLPNSYGSQPSMLPGIYGTSPNPSPILSVTSAIPNTSVSYNSSLPALSAPAPPATVKQEQNYNYSTTIDSPSQVVSSVAATTNSGYLDQKSNSVSDSSHLRARKMKISEIIDLLGPPAPAQQISHTEETFNEITKVYHEMYAGSLSAFFETTWYYFAEDGKMSFPKDANLIEHMATFLKILEAVKANDHTQMAYSGVLETRIVWELACTAYQIPERTNVMRLNLPPENDPTEARNRLQVVEALLCGDYLLNNPLSPPVADPDHHRARQFHFWYSLAEFVRKRDDPHAPSTVRMREDVLSRMRHLLDGRENRDVLYSIAVVRELAPNFEQGYANTIPQHLDESDPKNRLAVASKFILDESQVTGGTTNVVRRFSDIASRAFVNPGVNIARKV